MNIFRLKFAYKGLGEDGTVEKAKSEIFAECETYAEAEKMAMEYIAREDMSRYEMPEYEVIKTKFLAKDFIDANVLKTDGTLFEGKIEHYFSGSDDAFFVVNMKLITIDEKTGKEHKSPAVCIVSEASFNDAVVTVRNWMNKGLCDFVITSTKLDAAEALFLSPESHQFLVDRV